MGIGIQEALLVCGIAALLFGGALAPKFYGRAIDSIKAWKSGYKDASAQLKEDTKLIEAND